MLVRLAPESPEPLFEQIAASIRAELAAGRLAAGERLPTARELAAGLDVNIHTVLHAYQLLREEGVIEMRPGRGARITAHAAAGPAALRPQVEELAAHARELGLSPQALLALVQQAVARDSE